jgi:uncharacterized repeat protein (TIGR03803 family)
LIKDNAGNLYGTTVLGGQGKCESSKCGIVFKFDAAGHETVLHSFTGKSDGGQPQSGLVRDSAGNLYGTTFLGGSNSCGGSGAGCGVVFKLDAAGTETVLHTFSDGADGGFPTGGLVRDSAGNLYGTTSHGGASGNGVVFEITP